MTKTKIEQWAEEIAKQEIISCHTPYTYSGAMQMAKKFLAEAENCGMICASCIEDLKTFFKKETDEGEGELESGEYYLTCKKCGWKLEKNTATTNKCPDCGKSLNIISQP